MESDPVTEENDLNDQELIEEFRRLEEEYQKMYDSMVISHEAWIQSATGTHYERMLEDADYAASFLQADNERLVCGAIYLSARHASIVDRVVQYCADWGLSSASSQIRQASISVISDHCKIPMRSQIFSRFASLVADDSLDDGTRLSAYVSIVRLSGSTLHLESVLLPHLTVDDIDLSFVKTFL